MQSKQNSNMVHTKPVFKPISEFDHSRKTGKVLVKGPYYSHDTEIECKYVKFCYHATHYAEIEKL